MNKLTAIASIALSQLAFASGCTIDEALDPVALAAEEDDGSAAQAGLSSEAPTPFDHHQPWGDSEPPPPSYCGDGAVDEIEWCDDGNAIDGDGCSAVCFIEHGFTCLDSPSICASQCGDGLQASDEECDDGNVVDGDGCDAVCIDEPGGHCGDGIVINAIEDCDDGNIEEGDGCNSDCAVEDGFTCVTDPEIQQSVCEPCVDADGNSADC